MENPNSDIDHVVDRAVRRTLETLGFDMKDPVEIQRDIAFLRDTRKTTKKIGEHLTLLGLGSMALAALAALWVGIVQRITNHG